VALARGGPSGPGDGRFKRGGYLNTIVLTHDVSVELGSGKAISPSAPLETAA